MPAADGLSLVYHHLAEELGDEQPVYGLTSPGVYGEEVPYTIEEMAQRFVEDIREFRPHGPYLLMGYCSGGTLAFEAAQQLLAAGEQVAFVCGIETYDWGTAQSSRPTPLIKAYYNVQRLEFHLRNFWLLSLQRQMVVFEIASSIAPRPVLRIGAGCWLVCSPSRLRSLPAGP